MLRSVMMTLDVSDVERRMRLLNQGILPARIRKGLVVAGTQFMRDTVTGVPTMPIHRPGYSVLSGRQSGELRASGALYVDTVRAGDTRHMGETATGEYQPDSYGGTPVLPGTHEACVVFNAPYAAIQHEQWPKKTQPGAERYFMSEKLYGNGAKYIALIVEAVRL